jgi:DprA winged helix domain
LVAASLTGSGQKTYALLSSDDPRPIDDIVERTGLNSSDALATLFERICAATAGEAVQQKNVIGGRATGRSGLRTQY